MIKPFLAKTTHGGRLMVSVSAAELAAYDVEHAMSLDARNMDRKRVRPSWWLRLQLWVAFAIVRVGLAVLPSRVEVPSGLTH